MVEQDDIIYIKRCLDGNKNAFRVIVERYSGPVFNIACRLTGSRTDAADITQSVFLRIYENLDKFDQKNRFFSWLYRIAVNETINFIKKNQRIEILNTEVTDIRKNPGEKYSEKEMKTMIRVAVGELKLEYRNVVVLKYFQQLSYEEISKILNISVKKVKSRLFTARSQLKEILLKKGISTHG